jgi:hypothetical protein
MDAWRPLLVVCPASLRLTWADELDKWLPGLPPSNIHIIEHRDEWRPDQYGLTAPECSVAVSGHASGGPTAAVASAAGSQQALSQRAGDQPAPQQPHVVVVSYSLLSYGRCSACCKAATSVSGSKAMPGASDEVPRPAECAGWPHCITAGRFSCVIMDESHRLQTRDSEDALMVRIARQVLRQAERAILLSGTPSICRPFDLCGQLHSLQPERMGADFATFKTKFAFRCAAPHASTPKSTSPLH